MDKEKEKRLSPEQLMTKVDVYWKQQFNIDMLRDTLERVRLQIKIHDEFICFSKFV